MLAGSRLVIEPAISLIPKAFPSRRFFKDSENPPSFCQIRNLTRNRGESRR